MAEWIKCSDRMPPDGEYVLAWEKWSEVPFIGEYSRGCWGVSKEHYDCHAGWDGGVVVASVTDSLVTHWMPLPAKPEYPEAS